MTANKKIVFFSFCFVGCIYQLVTVSYEFFQFKVRTEITFEYPKEIEIPDIDIQIPIVNLLNMSAVYMRYPKEMVKICKDLVDLDLNENINSIHKFSNYCSSLNQLPNLSSGKIMPILTIGDIQQLTIDPRNMIIAIDNFFLNMDLLKEGFCEVARYHNQVFVHMRISCRQNSNPIVMKIPKSGHGDYHLLRVSLRIPTAFKLRLSKANSSLANYPYNYNMIDPQSKMFKVVVIKFRRLLSYSLPWPYETSCRHYDESVFLLDCINRRSLQIDNQIIHSQSTIPFNEHQSQVKFGDTHKLKKCFDECSALIKQPECESTIIYSEADEHAENVLSSKYQGKMFIYLIAPIDMDTISRAFPQNTLIEYLIYVSSTLGLWFGISVYGQLTDHSNQISKAFKKLIPCSFGPINPIKDTIIKIEANQLTW
ncbi:uncharacterized protein LOC128393016 [Panonychus citri]|uniref:uncharacterized protein LOC128393016 n=1 Tax=Panonychus citri TaxID=50023 RepID=UPI002307F8FC|nr:uncharacterized protein LOC128393016 [Panonychus citri]